MNTQNPLSYLSGFITEYPLYSMFGTDQPLEAEDLNNLQFNFFCENENRERIFKLEASSNNFLREHHSFASRQELDDRANGQGIGFTEMFWGICQSCEVYKISITVNAGTQKEKPKYFIRKIGQYPEPAPMEVKLPKQIHYFLNDPGRDLYKKALQNIESGQGTGAFAYFRKILESEMKRIIEMMSALNSPGTEMIREALSIYKKDHQRSKFIEDTQPHLSPALKEHGANVLLLMYDNLLVDSNELEEEECLKKAKDIDTLFRYLARKINVSPHEN